MECVDCVARRGGGKRCHVMHFSINIQHPKFNREFSSNIYNLVVSQNAFHFFHIVVIVVRMCLADKNIRDESAAE